MAITGSGIAYADIDNIPEELITVEYDIDKKTGETKGFKKPAKKKWVVELDGKQFEVVSKVQKTLTNLWAINSERQGNEEDEEERYTIDFYSFLVVSIFSFVGIAKFSFHVFHPLHRNDS